MTGEQARQGKDFWVAVSEGIPSHRYVFIPYQWLVLGYLAVWAGLVFWRSRKYRWFEDTD